MIMRKQTSPHQLCLRGLGLGDEVVGVLALSLPRFPDIIGLDLCGNRLTQLSLITIFQVYRVQRTYIGRGGD